MDLDPEDSPVSKQKLSASPLAHPGSDAPSGPGTYMNLADFRKSEK